MLFNILSPDPEKMESPYISGICCVYKVRNSSLPAFLNKPISFPAENMGEIFTTSQWKNDRVTGKVVEKTSSAGLIWPMGFLP